MHPIRKPRQLNRGLSTHHIDGETLIYDERRHKAFCLDRVASAIWSRCDGRHSIAEMAADASLELAAPVSEDAVLIALAQFEDDRLLEAEPVAAGEIPLATLGMVSRRNMIARFGASAVVLLPVVAAVMAPTAAQAYTGCFDCTVKPAPPGGESPRPSEPGQPSGAQPAGRPQLFNDGTK